MNMKMTELIMTYRLAFVAALVLILLGCEQSLTMETKTDVPLPLITQLPLNIGVYYDEQFSGYTYVEDSEDRPSWSIKSGASQVELFDQILPSMFQSIKYLNGLSDPQANNLDGIIVPHVEEMQFALPNETKTDLYEVWIKYKISLHNPDGELIAEWPLTGYGKSSTEFLKSREKGLHAAINLAFRDAGAKLAINFAKIAEVKQWLANKTAF